MDGRSDDCRMPGRRCPRWLCRIDKCRLCRYLSQGSTRCFRPELFRSVFWVLSLYRLLLGVLLQLHRLLPECLLQDHQIQILLLQRDQGRGSHVQGFGLPGRNSHRGRYSSQGYRGIFSTPIKLGKIQYLFLE